MAAKAGFTAAVNENLVTWPSPMSRRRQGTRRRHVITNFELSQLEPTPHGHEGVFSRSDNLMAESRA